MNVPNHIAIILDGNGQLGESKGNAKRTYGHVKGCANLETRSADDIKDLRCKISDSLCFFHRELEAFQG